MTREEIRISVVGEGVGQAQQQFKGLDGTLGGLRGTVDRLAGPSAGGLLSSLGGLATRFGIVSGVVLGVKKLFTDSLSAADEYRTAMQRLEGTAKLTGVGLEVLQGIAKTGEDRFKLSTVLANEFAAELAKLATKAGDVGQAGPALEAFLDIGAARGLKPAEILKAVQQAILGIDEGTDKLFGKNPSVLYAEFAQSIGTTAGRLTDQQKAQALLTATLADGLKVQGDYARILGSSAGATTDLATSWRSLKTEIGRAIQPLRDAGAALLAWPLKFVSDGLKALIDTFKQLSPEGGLGKSIEAGLRAAAGLDVSVPKPKKKGMPFELVFTYTPEELEKAHKERVEAQKRYQAKIEAVDALAAESALALLGEQQRQFLELTTKFHEKMEGLRGDDLARAQAQLATAQQNLLLKWSGLYQDVVPTVKAGETTIRQELVTTGEEFTDFTAVLRAHGLLLDDDARKKLEAKAKWHEFKAEVRQTADEVRDTAGRILELADALGIADDGMRQLAEGIGEVATGIGQIASGDILGGIASGISGIKDVIGGLFGKSEAEKRLIEALNRNADRVRELTESNAELLSINQSGKQISGIEAAIQAAFAKGTQRGNDFLVGGKKTSFNRVLGQELATRGLRISDLEGLAETLDLDLLGPNGAPNINAVRQLLAAIGQLDVGFGDSFGGKLAGIDRGLDFGTITKRQEFGALLGAAGSDNAIAAALAGLDVTTDEGRAGAIGALQDVFRNLDSLSKADFGDLNETQFLDLIGRLLGILRSDTAIEAFSLPGTAEAVDATAPLAEAFSTSLDELLGTSSPTVDYLRQIAENTRFTPEAPSFDPLGSALEEGAAFAGARVGTIDARTIGDTIVTVNVPGGSTASAEDIANTVIEALRFPSSSRLTDAIDQALAARVRLARAAAGDIRI